MKYFVVSDIHSFYAPLKRALKTAGFDVNNPSHTLIVCGDVFDRGPDTMKVYKFLKSIPEDRLALIRGNHEDLYLQLLEKGYPQSHDFSNGTVRTFYDIAGISGAQWNKYYTVDLWPTVLKKVKESEVTAWIKGNQWLNWCGVYNYLFTHAFIPIKCKVPEVLDSAYEQTIEAAQCSYDKKWQYASKKAWYEARWYCPFTLFDAGLFKDKDFKEDFDNGYTLVCGHWHASAFHDRYEGYSYVPNNKIYYGKNLIALDACTARSHSCNVLIIEDGVCYNKTHKKLKVKRGNKE